jgi:hypothetical protein
MGDDVGMAEQRMSRFTSEVAILADLYDRVGLLIQATAGVKPSDVPPYPRPVTAFQRARFNSNRAHHSDLVERLTPS